MNTITLPKTKYQALKKKAENYERILESAQASFFAPPGVTDRREVIGAFRKTKLYNRQFLSSLQRGLHRSSHFTG